MNTLYKNNRLTLLYFLIACILVALLASCRVDKITPAKEAVKDISGSWGVIKAVRNGVDVTGTYNFSNFRVNFAQDKSYTLTSPIPFIVSKSGTYSLDDPLYPFEITFNQQQTGAITTLLEYPLVNGKRQIKLTFSAGCNANSYVYTLQEKN